MGAYDVKPYRTAAGGTAQSRAYREGMGPDVNKPLHVEAIKALQFELLFHGYSTLVDGIFGLDTDRAVREFQEQQKLVVDGLVGPKTCRSLFRVRACVTELEHGVPLGYICGLIRWESAFDPGAIGANGADTGLVQINLNVHKNITMEQAVSSTFATRYAGERMRDAHAKFLPNCGDPTAWSCAVAQHNSPLWAKQWCQTGAAPNDQIATYVARIIQGC